MQPTRILPDLQCCLLCEQVRQEANGNFFLIGVLDFLRVPQLPVTASALSIFSRWTTGVGQFTQSVRFVLPDETTLLRKSDLKFAMQNPAINATTVTVFPNLEFAQPETYYVEVMVDDVMKLRFPVNIFLVAPPQQQQPGSPQPPKPEPPPSA